jgi:hypothetical protein
MNRLPEFGLHFFLKLLVCHYCSVVLIILSSLFSKQTVFYPSIDFVVVQSSCSFVVFVGKIDSIFLFYLRLQTTLELNIIV